MASGQRATAEKACSSGSATLYGSADSSEVSVSIETQRRKSETTASMPPTRWSSCALRGATSSVRCSSVAAGSSSGSFASEKRPEGEAEEEAPDVDEASAAPPPSAPPPSSAPADEPPREPPFAPSSAASVVEVVAITLSRSG